MSSLVPFVNSKSDVDLVKKYYVNAPAVRVSLASADIIPSIQRTVNLWLDSAFDAYHLGQSRDLDLRTLHKGLPSGSIVDSIGTSEIVEPTALKEFCRSLLKECLRYRPKWISVPQLPAVLNRKRYRLNRILARSAGGWRTEERFEGSLILPLIISHQDQVNKKPNRDKIFKYAKENLLLSAANSIWIVDMTLTDSSGSNTLRKRLANIIELHERFISDDSETRVIAGPYWALGLLLWAKGLAHFAATGTGRGYQYFLPGSHLQPGRSRIALGPLRRLSVATSELERWLIKASKNPSLDMGVRAEFAQLASKMSLYMNDRPSAKLQVVEFHSAWCAKLEKLAPEGRALALYQDLSQAFVIGSRIRELLPAKEKPATKPGQVAEQLMLNCL